MSSFAAIVFEMAVTKKETTPMLELPNQVWKGEFQRVTSKEFWKVRRLPNSFPQSESELLGQRE